MDGNFQTLVVELLESRKFFVNSIELREESLTLLVHRHLSTYAIDFSENEGLKIQSESTGRWWFSAFPQEPVAFTNFFNSILEYICYDSATSP